MSVNEGTGRTEPNRDTGDRVRAGAREAKSQVKEKANELKDRAHDAASRKYEEKKEQATGELHDVARALRSASDELDQNGRSTGRFFSIAAERVDDLAGRFEGRDLDGMFREAQRLARRNPGAFLAGTLAIGFVATRFLKASPPMDTWDRSDFESDVEPGYEPYRSPSIGNRPGGALPPTLAEE